MPLEAKPWRWAKTQSATLPKELGAKNRRLFWKRIKLSRRFSKFSASSASYSPRCASILIRHLATLGKADVQDNVILSQCDRPVWSVAAHLHRVLRVKQIVHRDPPKIKFVILTCKNKF